MRIHRRGARAVAALATVFLVFGIWTRVGADPPHQPVVLVSLNGQDGPGCGPIENPCGSLAGAYRAAGPDDVIEVAAGSYGPQHIPAVAGRAGPAVVIRPGGGAVKLDGLDVAGGHVDVRDIATGFVDVANGVSDVTVRRGGGAGIFVGGGTRRIAFIGGSYGGGAANVTPVKVQGVPAPERITFDGVLFHDAARTDDSSHVECLYAADVQHLTIRRSRFRNCAIMDLFITQLSGVDPRWITIENTFFDAAGSHEGGESKGYYAVLFSGAITKMANLTIRYNSFYGDGISFTAAAFADARVVGNVGAQTTCRPNVTFRFNVWTGTTCGATDTLAPSGFADPANYDLHLSPNAPPLLRGDPSDAPQTDIDGDPRPDGRAPDAGADQRTGAPGAPR